eukprot:241080_1
MDLCTDCWTMYLYYTRGNYFASLSSLCIVYFSMRVYQYLWICIEKIGVVLKAHPSITVYNIIGSALVPIFGQFSFAAHQISYQGSMVYAVVVRLCTVACIVFLAKGGWTLLESDGWRVLAPDAWLVPTSSILVLCACVLFMVFADCLVMFIFVLGMLSFGALSEEEECCVCVFAVSPWCRYFLWDLLLFPLIGVPLLIVKDSLLDGYIKLKVLFGVTLTKDNARRLVAVELYQATEALFESLPQLLLQSYMFYYYYWIYETFDYVSVEDSDMDHVTLKFAISAGFSCFSVAKACYKLMTNSLWSRSLKEIFEIAVKGSYEDYRGDYYRNEGGDGDHGVSNDGVNADVAIGMSVVGTHADNGFSNNAENEAEAEVEAEAEAGDGFGGFGDGGG